MKKLLGVLVVAIMSFGFITVNAADATLNKVIDAAKTLLSGSGLSGVTINEPKIDGKKLTIEVDMGGGTVKTLIFDYDSSSGKAVYNRSSQNVGERDFDRMILEYIVEAVATVNDQKVNGSVPTGDSLVNNIANYSYNKHGYEGSLSGSDVSTLTINLKCMNLSGNASSCLSNNNVANPKTGVFAPVAGLSVLIVASVVCLLWISKKTVYNGL